MIFKSFEVATTIDEDLDLNCLECSWHEQTGVGTITLAELITLAGRHYVHAHMTMEEVKDEIPEGSDGRQVQEVRSVDPTPPTP